MYALYLKLYESIPLYLSFVRRKSFLFSLSIIFGFFSHKVLAQDPQFTQFYAAPLYLNPAYAGGMGDEYCNDGRITMNYRNQWPNLPATFNTFLVGYDQHFPQLRSGIGLLIKHDQQFSSFQANPDTQPIRSTEAAAIYSYAVPLRNGFTMRLGLQAGLTIRDLDFSSFIFGDQVTDRGILDSPSAESFPGVSKSFVDISAGVMFFKEDTWLGVSVHHINEPNQSFLGVSQVDNLPRKIMAHIGHTIPLSKPSKDQSIRNKTITPVLMYKAQGKSDQMSLGLYSNFDPLLFGIWYRGLPIKNFDETAINSDAIAFLFGIRFNYITFGYSYDRTISELSAFTGGSHEISLQFNFGGCSLPATGGRYNRKKLVRCPSPWRRANSNSRFRKAMKRRR